VQLLHAGFGRLAIVAGFIFTVQRCHGLERQQMFPEICGEWFCFFTSKKMREYVGMSTHLNGSKPKQRRTRLIFWDVQIIPSMTVPIGLRSNTGFHKGVDRDPFQT